MTIDIDTDGENYADVFVDGRIVASVDVRQHEDGIAIKAFGKDGTDVEVVETTKVDK